MEQELIMCIPGPWETRKDFLACVLMLEPAGDYIFAGTLLSHISAKEYIRLTYKSSPDPKMAEAFQLAGKGRMSNVMFQQIREHKAVAYLHFPLDVLRHRSSILKFTQIMRQLGGLAIKIESAGIAHTWDQWFELLTEDPSDIYQAVVRLVQNKYSYYSCGMHHFGLPDTHVPISLHRTAATELINRFNLNQITNSPPLVSGQTIQGEPDSKLYTLAFQPDRYHKRNDLFYNPYGVWELICGRVEQTTTDTSPRSWLNRIQKFWRG